MAERTNPTEQPALGAPEIKACCVALYEGDWARLLLGDSFHPGGSALTLRLGSALGLGPGMRVLDVAAGKGASAILLARHFRCEVVGVDLSAANVEEARATARAAGLADHVRFLRGDAERLPVDDGACDVAICECTFCTFPGKARAAAELARVLRPGGRVGLTDLTRAGDLPAELRTLLAWVACIADAQPVTEYVGLLKGAGFTLETLEAHDAALAELVQTIRTRLLGAELLVKLKKLSLPGADFEQGRTMAHAAAEAVRVGRLGYALLTARRPVLP